MCENSVCVERGRGNQKHLCVRSKYGHSTVQYRKWQSPKNNQLRDASSHSWSIAVCPGLAPLLLLSRALAQVMITGSVHISHPLLKMMFVCIGCNFWRHTDTTQRQASPPEHRCDTHSIPASRKTQGQNTHTHLINMLWDPWQYI